ncbi:hypothetical protein ES705_23652 [subsurface metagenome]
MVMAEQIVRVAAVILAIMFFGIELRVILSVAGIIPR